MAPRPEDRFAGRAAEAATDQVRLDGGRVDPYDEHSGASASSGRAPSRSVERLSEGLLRVQVVITLPSTRSLGKPNPPPRLLTIERGAANAPTKPCSRSAATEGLPMINERGAQHLAMQPERRIASFPPLGCNSPGEPSTRRSPTGPAKHSTSASASRRCGLRRATHLARPPLWR